ncbi:MAG: MBOAT family O-acyltransferase [Rhizobiaceae bacterium]|nr:MBOAT family O-acyltransferase [Rhizobiaceae bacterium]
MVFNSYEFILVFLPLAFLAFAMAYRIGGWNAAYTILGLVSLVFYAQLGIDLLGILVISIVANFVVGNLIIRTRETAATSKSLLAFGIVGNLIALGHFKYTNFLFDISNQFVGTDFSHASIILPIGISFYTFIQIGYLVDCYGGTVKSHSFFRYLTFASLFPCVTAGPLVLQKEIFGQMESQRAPLFDLSRISMGLTMFSIGLFKKVVLADSIAAYSNTVFNGVAGGQGLDAVTAWAGAMAYTFQLYFDFSGYSDMALGLGAIFGLMLPLNFNSPLKATSISDFWQRWHMTMTRFFTNYVFTPMSVSAMRNSIVSGHGPVRKFIGSGGWPIVLTMLVAGIWHGSGWVFVLFGLLHGFAIAINNAWRQFNMPQISKPMGWILTMLVVVSGLVIFRSPDVGTAGTILATMFGGNLLGYGLAEQTVQISLIEVAPLLLLFWAIVLLTPNSQEITSAQWYSTTEKPTSLSDWVKRFSWRPQPGWGAIVACVFVVSFVMIGTNSTFLYYQF